MDTRILEEVGLTKSEIKVYLALIELGSTSKGPLVKKARITSSKIYEIMDKLIEKGLASYILKNKVRYFKAASPRRILDYLKEKKENISKQEISLKKLLPSLEKEHESLREEINAEIFIGWRGIETVFEDILNTLNKGDIDYVFGASKGTNPIITRRFFDKYIRKTKEKGIKIKVIFNEDSREYYNKAKAPKSHIKAKYLRQATPSEINIYDNKVIIIILSESPIGIMIKGKEVASSFKQYFDTMWNIAKR